MSNQTNNQTPKTEYFADDLLKLNHLMIRLEFLEKTILDIQKKYNNQQLNISYNGYQHTIDLMRLCHQDTIIEMQTLIKSFELPKSFGY